ncbi:MAG: hypothetical protein LBI15_01960 [Dysgonamonadaceae bacterium]|jgi:hypothetical protein|nr:hypothetical protein [Dysgonamonadaceae bacterium]
MAEKRIVLKIRLLTLLFMAALIVSGITAFPIEIELRLATQLLNSEVENPNALQSWLVLVYEGIKTTNAEFPFLAYGTDWLAFAHIVIALAFIGLYRDPVRNKWLVSWAMICCISVIPLALICGAIRQIPFFWQLIDIAFGVFGMIPLIYLRRLILKLEKMNS